MSPTNLPEPMASIGFTLEGDDFQMQARVTVPAGLTQFKELLPLAQHLSDRMVEQGVKAVEAAGRKISCGKGCGACCRNLVAISEVEARRIRDLVEELPEPRRSEIKERFGLARQRLEEAGLLERLQRPEKWDGEEYQKLITSYFPLQIACPFLEQESCSIYEDRPLTCREFLVVSPPEHCAEPAAREVLAVRLPLHVFHALARVEVPADSELMERVVPLILAPEWAESHPDEAPLRTGPEWFQEFLHHLSAKPPAV